MYYWFVPISAIFLGLLITFILNWILNRLSRQEGDGLSHILLKRCRPPLWVLIPVLLALVAIRHTPVPGDFQGLIPHVLSIGLISGCGWLLVTQINGLRDYILRKYDISTRDNLKARAVHTQVNIIVRFALIAIVIFAFSSILMTFEIVRQVGIGLLASAGVVGIVIGFAAQQSLATLIAGLQIAVTQPIRLDDVVIVEGEWGRIEEITLTYVVVRIWDHRRLVLPVSHFLQKPFQNWTRTSADILGTVFLYADYAIDVDAVRAELHRLLQASEKWDGRTWGLQVTNSSDKAIEMRALMSAPDASVAWDLRCEIREKLLCYLQKNFSDCLPKIRAELTPPPAVRET
ncbi:MAG: mechanosensitive ion channel [Deltaproteobacteria bacterium]|nr:mechanosensitive ion channel [Deltaproteobacteria bacterium]